MTRADVNHWLGQKESATLEFKASADPRAIAEVICGMLNAEGGVVVAGVDDDGSLIGIEDPDGVALLLDGYARKRISPPAPWAVMPAEADGKSVVVIDIPSGPRKPYVVDGKVFVRVARSNRPADAQDIDRLIQQRLRQDQHWERLPAIGMTADDLDVSEIQRTVREAVDAGRFDPVDDDRDSALRRLNLVIEGRPIQAAVVAFASEVMPWYPQCSLRLARFKENTKDEFIDQQKVVGHAFRLLAEAHSFLSRHLPIRGSFESGNLRREDEPLYPILALREALVNAFCHRDYSIAGGAVSVAIFDDRLEVASTGTLPDGLTVDDLKRQHFSQPRNPLLADVFYRRGLIELWGRGTQGIVRLCIGAGCPEPQFEERAGEFVVRFFAPTYSVARPKGVDVTERQARILALLRHGTKLTLKDVREGIDASLSDSTIRSDLSRLRELGLVESAGIGRGAYWRLVRLAPAD